MLLYEILKTRNLEKPDGRPIYAYQITSQEYEQLQVALRAKSHRLPKDWANVEAAEFCIFVAEWWRRNYDGGHWSWEGPLSEVGLRTWSPSHRTELVKRGLRYLDREVIELSGGRQFLGTLATEGGLPLQLVLSEKNALIEAFRSIFEELQTYKTGDVGPARFKKLGNPEMNRFSEVYQRAEHIPALLGKIASKVWGFAAHIEKDITNPFVELDRKVPKWRSQLPLQVDESQIKALLEDILGVATELRAEVEAEFQVLRTIEKTPHGKWALLAQIRPPQKIPARQLARAFDVEESSLPYALKLKAKSETQERFFAQASRESKSTLRISPARDRSLLQESDAIGAIYLVAYAGENEFGQSHHLLAEPLGDDGPWIFSKNHDINTYELIATGSISTRQEEIFVAVANTTIIQIELGSSEEILAIGERKLYRVQGEVGFIEADGTRWRIRCNQAADQYFDTRIQGLHWDLEHADGLPIYREKPDIRLDQRYLDRHELYWLSHQARSRVQISKALPGDGRIQVLDDEGAVIMQRRICRLPDDATIRVFPAQNDRPGFLRLRNFGSVQDIGCPKISIEVQDITHQSGIDGNDHIDLQIHHKEERSPALVPLSIRWGVGAETCLKVPFPREIARFVYSDQVLDRQAQWVAHSLGTLQAEVAPHQNLHSTPTVTGRLSATDISQDIHDATSFEVALRPEYIRRQPTGRYLLSLGRIREHINHALAGTMDLDAFVELSIYWDGIRTPEQPKIDLFRYEGEIKRSSDFIFQPEFRFEIPRHWGTLRLIAFRFQDPATTHELYPTTDGEWLADTDDWEPGTWCVVGIRDGNLSHRPHIFTIEGEYKATEWAEICEIPTPKTRRKELHHLFEKLAEDFEHNAWNWIGDTFELARELPATTFDSLDCLVMVPQACATAFLRAGAHRIERWWSELEELPFAWQLISIRDWKQAFITAQRAIERQAAKLGHKLKSTTHLEYLVEHIRTQLGGHSPAFIYLNEQLGLNLDLSMGELFFARENDAFLVQELLKSAFEELLARKAHEDRWPKWDLPHEIRTESCFATFYLGAALNQHERWRQAVLNAPVVAAMACALSLRLRRSDAIYLRRIRNFDSNWFDLAYRVSLARIIAQTPDKRLLGEGSLLADAPH